MSRRAGSADLPLHGGRVPAWLGQRMTKLGTVITQAIILHYGRDEFLRRLAHPFWFQSFGAVMGMDWHSSGITTSVLGALKRGLTPLSAELGLHVCGGRGRHSRATPDELLAVGNRTGLDGSALARTSRMIAKVDSAAVQEVSLPAEPGRAERLYKRGMQPIPAAPSALRVQFGLECGVAVLGSSFTRPCDGFSMFLGRGRLYRGFGIDYK